MKTVSHRDIPAPPCGPGQDRGNPIPTGVWDRIRRADKFSFFSTFLLIFTTLTTPVSPDDSHVYTNKDLAPYERQYRSERKSARETEAPIQKRTKRPKTSGRTRHTDEKEYWCRRGTAAQEEIDRAQKKVLKAEEDCAEMRSKKFWGKATQHKVETAERKLEKARQDLQAAERAFRMTDDEAHRKGILPGWLRCQF